MDTLEGVDTPVALPFEGVEVLLPPPPQPAIVPMSKPTINNDASFFMSLLLYWIILHSESMNENRNPENIPRCLTWLSSFVPYSDQILNRLRLTILFVGKMNRFLNQFLAVPMPLYEIPPQGVLLSTRCSTLHAMFLNGYTRKCVLVCRQEGFFAQLVVLSNAWRRLLLSK